MRNKVIIIGASTVGKTTVIKHLTATTNLNISESDDMLTELNGGTYPSDSNYKMNVLAPQMVKNVLNRKNVIFFTNTHYFKPDDLKVARRKGFRIILLSLDREKMTIRSKYREENEGYEDHTKYFDDMLKYQEEILAKGFVDTVIDTDKPVEEISKRILSDLEV